LVEREKEMVYCLRGRRRWFTGREGEEDGLLVEMGKDGLLIEKEYLMVCWFVGRRRWFIG